MQEEGYLFFNRVLDLGMLSQIRREILELAEEDGLIAAGTDLMDGIFSGQASEQIKKNFQISPLYRKILDLPSFNQFPQSPFFHSLFSAILGGEVQEHRRRISRITFPQSRLETTPAHQDFFYIRGAQDTYTAWIACGDCPSELGGVAVLEGSNHLGFLGHAAASGTGGYGIPEEVYAQTGLQWLTTDFKMGDLLIFHSFTIHRGLDNETEDKLRVSMDYRFQLKKDPIDPSSMELHMKEYFEI